MVISPAPKIGKINKKRSQSTPEEKLFVPVVSNFMVLKI
jgi:hypothetical protein